MTTTPSAATEEIPKRATSCACANTRVQGMTGMTAASKSTYLITIDNAAVLPFKTLEMKMIPTIDGED